ncbi:MAG: ATPase [Gammaproteobacteria bacterium]|nr:ATPase [Gammaproteobacteria bacterium]MDH3859074.1 ATPase [Gammaproteobacteria bacterium]
MKFNIDEFRAWENKRVTLVGMSGVGKSYLSAKLRGRNWFHYSGDYRIGTRYLDEHIVDMIKHQAIRIPFLKELLRNDWIYIKNNIRVNDLGPVLSFVGKLGNPELGGVELGEFIERQAIYRQAEVDAMYDIPHFVEKAQEIYGYPHFVNDVGGSLCELDEPGVMDILVDNTLILYIQVTNDAQEKVLIERAVSDPKPLYYRPEFLEEHLQLYYQETGLEYVAQIDPDEFARWVFPRLFHSRLPRYDAIAKLGYTVTSEEVDQVENDTDFLDMLEMAIERQQGEDA